ncbi:hypothetical protein PR048_012220 [Dryococelus australis]|uniref:Uncharacterized protein n=1 Tax=Dryococelus australis TaxID=614101 RepID=A0ABQ9HPE0_9NEOP|nr:hypothetical protein PR048_012220 [Dryococelus australis]
MLRYYERKYSIYNLMFYESGSKLGICYIWGEADEKRGTNEIFSILTLYVSEVDKRNVVTVVQDRKETFKYLFREHSDKLLAYQELVHDCRFNVCHTAKHAPRPLPFYKHRLPITPAKFVDLKQLCTSGVIPERYHNEYLRLTTMPNVPDVLSESDAEGEIPDDNQH